MWGKIEHQPTKEEHRPTGQTSCQEGYEDQWDLSNQEEDASIVEDWDTLQRIASKEEQAELARHKKKTIKDGMTTNQR
jgi:hypothetical protein